MTERTLVNVPGCDPEALHRLLRIRRIHRPAALLFRPEPGAEAEALRASRRCAEELTESPVAVSLSPRATVDLLADRAWTSFICQGLVGCTAAAPPAPTLGHERYRSPYEELAHLLLCRHPDVKDTFDCNVRIRGASGAAYEVDLFCRTKKLAIEIDGLQHLHDPRQKFRDQKRDADLAEEEIQTLRIHAHQVTKDPSAFITAALEALGVRT